MQPFNPAAGVADGRPACGVDLCALDALADPGARGFAFPAADPEGRPFRGFVVRRGGEVVGHVDSCPHTGAALPAEPDRYLDRTGAWILCWTHGAMFRPQDGLCVAGPCVNRSLRPWPVLVRDGRVVTA